jgi:hypothetical protein
VIAIKNADGTLVPVADGLPGVSRSVALSLVHSNQKRAEIQLYEIDPVPLGEHPAIAPGQEPFGVLAIKKLPENPFGEVEITATIDVDLENNVRLSAEAEGIRPVSGVFPLPGAKRPASDPLDLSAFDAFGASNHEDLPPPHEDLPHPADLTAPDDLATPDAAGLPDLDFDLGAGGDLDLDADALSEMAAPDAGDQPDLDDFLGAAVPDGSGGAVPDEPAESGFGDGDIPAEPGGELDDLSFDLGGLDGIDGMDALGGQDADGPPTVSEAIPEEPGEMALPDLDDDIFDGTMPDDTGGVADMDDLFGGNASGGPSEAVDGLDEVSFDLDEPAADIDVAGNPAGESAADDVAAGLPDLDFDMDGIDGLEGMDSPGSLNAEEVPAGAPEDFAGDAGGMSLPDLDDQSDGSAREAGFIDDPDNNDWGFDELAEPELAEGPGESPAAGASDDFSFGEEALDLGSDTDDGSFGAADLDRALDADDGLDEAVAVVPARPGKTPVRPATAAERPARQAPREKPARAERPVRQRAEAEPEARGSVIPRLMKASIALFAVSLVELGVYLFLRFNIFP